MTIDNTKRLATDAGYWRECRAPEDATHWISGLFRRWQDGQEFLWIDDERLWACPLDNWSLEKHMEWTDMQEIIPRPQSEWVDGLPPVGFTENDCELVGVEGFREGFEVVAHKGVAAIVWGPYEDDPEGQVETLLASHFRPIPTKAQRDRDELSDSIQEVAKELMGGKFTIEFSDELADAILSRYNLEPKQ